MFFLNYKLFTTFFLFELKFFLTEYKIVINWDISQRIEVKNS
jgi:hypothetical protein